MIAAGRTPAEVAEYHQARKDMEAAIAKAAHDFAVATRVTIPELGTEVRQAVTSVLNSYVR